MKKVYEIFSYYHNEVRELQADGFTRYSDIVEFWVNIEGNPSKHHVVSIINIDRGCWFREKTIN